MPIEVPIPEGDGYLRFVGVVRSRGRALRLGLFQGSDRFHLRGRGKTELEAVYEWFNDQLPVPPRAAFEGGTGRCWFRTDWDGFVRELWGAARRIEEAGYRVWQVYNRNPGRITYQDDFQVVAVPRWNARGWPQRVH
jgi:hypothetical protein